MVWVKRILVFIIIFLFIVLGIVTGKFEGLWRTVEEQFITKEIIIKNENKNSYEEESEIPINSIVGVSASNLDDELNTEEWTLEDLNILDYPNYVSSSEYHPIIETLFDRFFDGFNDEVGLRISELRQLLSHTYIIKAMTPELSTDEISALDLLVNYIYLSVDVLSDYYIEEQIANITNFQVPERTLVEIWFHRTNEFEALRETNPKQYDHMQMIGIVTGFDPRVYGYELESDGFYIIQRNENLFIDQPTTIMRYNEDSNNFDELNPYDRGILPFEKRLDFTAIYGIDIPNNYIFSSNNNEAIENNEFPVMNAMEFIQTADENNFVYLDPQYEWNKSQLEELEQLDVENPRSIHPIIVAFYDRFFDRIVSSYNSLSYGEFYQVVTSLLSHIFIIEEIQPNLNSRELEVLDRLQSYIYFAMSLFETDRIFDPQSVDHDQIYIPLMIQIRTLKEEFEEKKDIDPIQAYIQQRIANASGFSPKVYLYSYDNRADYLIEKSGYRLIGDLAWLYNYNEDYDTVEQYNPYGDMIEEIPDTYDFETEYGVKVEGSYPPPFFEPYEGLAPQDVQYREG